MPQALQVRPTLIAPRSVPEPGRFHLYADWAAPAAHRSTLVIALAGIGDAVSVSYPEDARSDVPSLPEAYAATEGLTGARRVPALWDRRAHTLVSNDYPTLEKDLAIRFGSWSRTGLELYPAGLRAEIDEIDRWLGRVVDQGPSRSEGPGSRAGLEARNLLNEAFARLDRILARSRYLVGEQLTLADVRLWVCLVRFGADAGQTRRISSELAHFGALWAYAQGLYDRPEFRATTRPEAFRRS
jgi:glutathionyl-hydroquinone reductase